MFYAVTEVGCLVSHVSITVHPQIVISPFTNLNCRGNQALFKTGRYS